ncbi:MAG TPA: phenylacetate--CoA ligase PaaK [Gammaproteobacteria bacterium]|jgi:phenylacetate-CoA ligase|nr:phenylacetate--CoA ligase [Gammaproteobacteria bacterium]HJP38704.1 phenylacetate--CoA ligase PaaK [Gammaproteobacteria bacterium]
MNVMAAEKKDLDHIETASRDELQALQLSRLKKSLSHCYQNVPHYRKTFDAAGVHPADLKALTDLSNFPLLSKQDLRENYPFGMFAVPREEVVRIHASSGTTGKPTVVGYTRADIDVWAGVMARSIRAAGGRKGDIVHVAFGYGLFTGGLGAHYGAEKLGCTVVPMGGGQGAKQAQLIQDFKPDIIMVTPSYMLALVEEFVRQGIDPADTSLRIAMHGAEPWSNKMRGEIERVFDLDALDLYGLSEVIGPGVAQECIETKDGPTIWEDHFYPEIINPETGEVVPDGEVGELVFTSLTKQAMPIVRYRTRDLTRLLPGTARTMRRIEKITGRNDDMMIIRGVNVFPSQIEELVLQDERLSPHYLLEIMKDGPLDALTVKVETRPVFHEAGQDAHSACAAHLVEVVKEFVGVTVNVELVAPLAIPRSMGKAQRVVDKRG